MSGLRNIFDDVYLFLYYYHWATVDDNELSTVWSLKWFHIFNIIKNGVATIDWKQIRNKKHKSTKWN